MIKSALNELKIPKYHILSYIIVYLTIGFTMHNVGIFLQIAKFKYDFQVITCYIFYMVPISIYMRNWKTSEQYVYGMFTMAILEFLGYFLETSYAFPNNLLERLFGIRNFSLVMTIFFSFYFPVLNWLTWKFYEKFFKKIE
jgi:hypothetical protein